MKRPFLKWAGGKFRLLEKILPQIPVNKRYIEPFAGSAAVYLNTKVTDAIVNDANQDLITLYTYIQEEGEKFIKYASSYFTLENNTADAFYKLRAEFNATQSAREGAAIFIYLNKHAYNGLIRYNGEGGYNVPFGKYKAPKFPLHELENFLERTRQGKTIFTCRDFRDVFADAVAGDVFYCDPPYAPLSKTANFTNYSASSFTAGDQEDLANLARAAHKKGAKVIVSNHDTPLIRQLYSDAKIIAFDVQRFISCKGNARNKVPEILAVYG